MQRRVASETRRQRYGATSVSQTRPATTTLLFATAATIVLTLAAPSGITFDAQVGAAPDPDRIYSHQSLGSETMLDLVCAAALATAYELDATTVQTSLDPLTGTPLAGTGTRQPDRVEWIDAHFELGDPGGEFLLSIEIRPAGDLHPLPGSPHGHAAVAVSVDARPSHADSGEESGAGELTKRFLDTLDHAVERRIRSASGGIHHGPTPTPWIGPPLEPTPLGPPELVPPPPGPRP